MRQSLRMLPDIALFVEVARTGSFRRAAERLELPPATLSRRIAAMEARLGVTLFQRTTRSVTPTPVARTYLERCLAVLDAAESAQAAIEADREQAGRIRISMPVDLGVEVLGPIIASFGAERPGLRIDLDLATRAADLLRDPVDLAFRIGKPLDERVVARRIAQIRSGIYAAPSFLRRTAAISEAGQLERVRCLNLLTAQGPMPWTAGNLRWDAAPGPHTLSANSVALIGALAERGYGLALLPDHIAAPGVAAKRLARVLADQPTPVWPLYAITASRLAPAPVRHLIAHVATALRASSISTRVA